MPNKDQQKPAPARILQAYHHEAIEQRYLGKTYKEIAEYLSKRYAAGKRKDFKEVTVRFWFGTVGMLYDAYFEYSKSENERRRRAMTEELKKLLPMVPKKLLSILERKMIYLDKKNGKIVVTEQDVADKTTLGAVALLLKTLGFALDASDHGDDPSDHFFNRLDGEPGSGGTDR